MLIKEPAGVYWLIGWATIPVFFVMLLVLTSLDEISGLEITLGTAFTFAAFLIYALAALYMAKGEAVHLEASLAPLANVGRMRHLRTLSDVARAYRWRVHGPYPPHNVIVVDGAYNGRAIRIESGMGRPGDYYWNMYVQSRNVLWPACAIRRAPLPALNVIESAHYERRRIGGRPVHIYLWPPEARDVDEDALDRLACFLESRQSLWRGRMVVRSYSDAVLLHRASYLHVKLPAGEIEAILEWLADLGTMMEDSGLAEPEARPEETESEVVS